MSAKTEYVSITLKKPHRHGGREYAPGNTLTLAEHKAEWLVNLGVATRDKPAAATGLVKVFTAAGWAAHAVKVWTGAMWRQSPVRRWTGASWT